MAYYVKYNWFRRASNCFIKRRKSLSHWPMFIYVHIISVVLITGRN